MTLWLLIVVECFRRTGNMREETLFSKLSFTEWSQRCCVGVKNVLKFAYICVFKMYLGQADLNVTWSTLMNPPYLAVEAGNCSCSQEVLSEPLFSLFCSDRSVRCLRAPQPTGPLVLGAGPWSWSLVLVLGLQQTLVQLSEVRWVQEASSPGVDGEYEDRCEAVRLMWRQEQKTGEEKSLCLSWCGLEWSWYQPLSVARSHSLSLSLSLPPSLSLSLLGPSLSPSHHNSIVSEEAVSAAIQLLCVWMCLFVASGI